MTDAEINQVVSELLHRRFADLGFERSTVKSEEDFDGSSIIRVTAYFKSRGAPTDQLIDSFHDVRSELLRRGEERFVFWGPAFPHDQDEMVDEDLE
jgi:hypothetical protein